MKSTTRLQIELPKASMDRLRTLKDKTEAVSYAEVVRDAFKLYELMIEYTEAGSDILIRDKEGNIREIELFY
jgi:hypothetical protein